MLKLKNPIYLFLFIISLTARADTLNSSVKISNESSDLIIRVVPNEGLQLTYEGPWTLNITNMKNFNFEKTKFTKSDMNTDTGEFKISGAKLGKNWNADYELVSFVCTKDKTRCFREVHKGKLNTKAPTTI